MFLLRINLKISLLSKVLRAWKRKGLYFGKIEGVDGVLLSQRVFYIFSRLPIKSIENRLKLHWLNKRKDGKWSTKNNDEFYDWIRVKCCVLTHEISLCHVLCALCILVTCKFVLIIILGIYLNCKRFLYTGRKGIK